MSRRQIGQETFGFSKIGRRSSCLDDLAKLIDWLPIGRHLADISNAAKGEPAWPPPTLFKAFLLAVWYDLSDVKLDGALDDRASAGSAGSRSRELRGSAQPSGAFARR
jgi:IS5 family transposase